MRIDECPNCGKEIDNSDLAEGVNGDGDEIETECPHCETELIGMFCVNYWFEWKTAPTPPTTNEVAEE